MRAHMAWLRDSMLGLGMVWLALGNSHLPSAFSDEPSGNDQGASGAAARERLFPIQVLDEQHEPLVDVAIAVFVTMEGVEPPLQHSMQLITQADGRAVIDMTAEAGLAATGKAKVLVWKSGYQIASKTLPLSGPVVLPPEELQAFKISGIDSQPLAQARLSLESVDSLMAIPREWSDAFRAESDQYGRCQLPVPASGIPRIRIEPKVGPAQLVELRRRLSTFDSRPDHRDTVFVRLAPTGTISGTLPRQYASKYRIRLVPTRLYSATQYAQAAQWRAVAEPDEAGHFEFRDIVIGRYQLKLERETKHAQTDDAFEKRKELLSFAPIVVEPSKTSTVKPELLTGAEVVGRVVSDQTDADYSGVRVSVGLVEQAPAESYERYLGSVQQLTCDADGQYSAVLPAGNYRFSVVQGERWLGTESANLTIGPGAAMLRIADLKVRPLRKVNVRITEESWKELEPYAGDALSVMATYPQKVSTTETFGLVSLQGSPVQTNAPAEMEPKEIAVMYRTFVGLKTRMVDLDPSPDFELAIDRQASGMEKNVSFRLRVVDQQEAPLSRIPVRITVRTQTQAAIGSLGYVPSSSRSFARGTPLSTDKEGWIRLPPAQLFKTSYITSSSSSASRSTSHTRAMIEAEALGGDGYSQAREWLFSSDPGVELPDEIRLDNIVLDEAPAVRPVVGRLTSASGQPLGGRVVWIACAPGMLRGVTDSQGKFRFEGIDKRAWFLSDVNWTIEKVADLPEGFEVRESVEPEVIGGRSSRLALEQRRKLAAVQLDKAYSGVANARRLSGIPDLPVDAYLAPDKYFDLLSKDRFGDRALDSQRLSFLNWWSELDEEKVRQLIGSAVAPTTRAHMLKILADRLQEPRIYEEAMNSIEFAKPEVRRPGRLPPGVLPVLTYDTTADALVSELGLELFRRGMLQPHLAKVQAVVERYDQNRAKQNRPLQEGYEPEPVARCRALLNPDQFLASLEEIDSENSLAAESRVGAYRKLETAALIFPEKMLQRTDRFPIQSTVWSLWGKSDPLAALQRLIGPISIDELSAALLARIGQQDRAFAVCDSALLSGHSDAVAASQELCRAIRDFEVQPNRLSMLQPEVSAAKWCQTLNARQPNLSRQAKWHAALYQFTKEDALVNDRSSLIFSFADPDSLRTALCIGDVWPGLSEELVARTKNRFQRELQFQRTPSLSNRAGYEPFIALLAYFDPPSAIRLVADMESESERLAEANAANAANANRPAGLPSTTALMLQRQMNTYRLSLVRGLLLSESQLISH